MSKFLRVFVFTGLFAMFFCFVACDRQPASKMSDAPTTKLSRNSSGLVLVLIIPKNYRGVIEISSKPSLNNRNLMADEVVVVTIDRNGFGYVGDLSIFDEWHRVVAVESGGERVPFIASKEGDKDKTGVYNFEPFMEREGIRFIVGTKEDWSFCYSKSPLNVKTGEFAHN